MRENRNVFFLRGVYGLLFVIMVVGALLLGSCGFWWLMLAIIVGGSHEFGRIARLSGYKPRYVISLLSSVLLLSLNYQMLFGQGLYVEPLTVAFMLTIPTFFVAELFTGSRQPIANIGVGIFPLIYIALPAALLCNVALMIGGGEWNGLLMIAYITIIWANDTFAYLVGITLGRHIMFPRISPKKSWEGFFGGVIGSLFVGLLAAHIFSQNYFVWGGMAIIASVTGVLGDLVESMLKRSVKIKDSGNILPGHGGWLDRFDALLISTPVVYAYLYILSSFNLV